MLFKNKKERFCMKVENKKRICVYCSSSNNLSEKFYTFAKELGEKIAENNYNMVYGGTTIGMMGVIASNAQNNGSHVIGVIPEIIASYGLKNLEFSENIITKDMRERKAVMEKYADIFVAAPGGFGTFEEIFEIIVSKQLGYHNKPIIFLNFDNFYNNMFKMFDTVYEYKFAQEKTKELYHISESIDDMFLYIENYKPIAPIIKY